MVTGQIVKTVTRRQDYSFLAVIHPAISAPPHTKPIKSLFSTTRRVISSTVIPDRLRLLIYSEPRNAAFYWRGKY